MKTPRKARSRSPRKPRARKLPDLHTLIASRGISQRRFSADLGVDESYVSHVLRGSKQPSFRLATKMADALGIPLGDFRVMLERSVR